MLLGRRRVRRTDDGSRQPRRRLASSVRLPWLTGLIVLLLLAAATAVLVGRPRGDQNVPGAVMDAQLTITESSAQSVRKGVNEGIDDLDQLAQALAARAVPVDPAMLGRELEVVRVLHGRYRAAYAVDTAHAVIAAQGESTRADLLPAGIPTAAGMNDAVDAGVRPLIQQYAPATVAGRRIIVVGHYDVEFLRFPLEIARPGSAWVVNRRGQIIGSTTGFSPFAMLPRASLRAAAARSARGDSGAKIYTGSLDSSEIVAFAPVTGPGPSGQLGWSVVSARDVQSISLPATDFRRQALLFATLLAILTALIFGWLEAMVLRPLRSLQAEAERVAYGNLREPVEIRRYDEIGLVARSLERVRILLIRRRMQDSGATSATVGDSTRTEG